MGHWPHIAAFQRNLLLLSKELGINNWHYSDFIELTLLYNFALAVGLYKKLFSGYETFSSANEANAFFGDDNNCKPINDILLEDENGNGHMAYVKSYSKGQINFTGYSIFDTQKTSYDGGKIKPNGNFQNGWKIVGVIFKPSK